MLSSTGTLTKDECTHCHYCTAAQATVRRGKLQLWLQWHYDSKHNTDRKLRIGCLFAQDTCDASPGLTAKRKSKLTSCNLLQYCTWSVLVKSFKPRFLENVALQESCSSFWGWNFCNKNSIQAGRSPTSSAYTAATAGAAATTYAWARTILALKLGWQIHCRRRSYSSILGCVKHVWIILFS